MSRVDRLHPMIEGRSGSRIDCEQGGRYLGIPRNRPVRAFTTVQRTGCGTDEGRTGGISGRRSCGSISVAEDGHGPLVVPIWYSYGPGGEVRSITGRTSRKGKLLERAGRFSLCVQTETPPYKYVSVEGPIVAVEAADLERDRRPVARRYLGTEVGDRTSKARGTWSGTCLFVCGQNDGSPSTTQSIRVTVNGKPANHALHLTAERAHASPAAGECGR